MKFIIASLFIAFSGAALAQQSPVLDTKLKTKMQQEIDYIGNLYGTVYAPKNWKESHLGWNLSAQVALAQAKLASAQNIKDARQAAADLIKSTADYHVSYSFYSTEKATLPFQVKTVEGKTLIVYIDRNKLSEAAFPFAVGDELLTMGQAPIGQVLNELMKSLGTNVPGTDLAMADLYVTRRAGKLNVTVPHGPVMVSVKRADGSVGTVQLAWDYIPERLSNIGQTFSMSRPHNSLMQKMMMSPLARDFAMESTDENHYGLGVRESFLPDFGERLWQSEKDSTFDAYIFKNAEGQQIGVLRIPMYETEDYVKAVADFGKIIAEMEKSTSALIIDQNNNPGGSVFYLYSLVSMLSDQPMSVPRHRVSLMPSDVSDCLPIMDAMSKVKNDEDAAKLLGDLNGYPATYQLAVATNDYCQNVVQEFHSGQTLSSPLHLWGVDQINPNPTHYTKPIVLLVNQLDFSGGDFFPATMQDNKRAVIVGTRTAGAGGYILEAQFPNNLGLQSLSFTGSIAERIDHNPIENLGVTPDISLPMTVEDVRYGYKPYQAEVQNIVKGLIK